MSTRPILQVLKFLKEWWIEIILVLTLFFIIYEWSWVKEILQKYQVIIPALFYLGCEIVWDISALLTVIYTGIFGSIAKKYKEEKWYKWFHVTLRLPFQVRELIKESRPKTRAAWFWFWINRIAALIQPGTTLLILVLYSKLPTTIALPIYVFLLADLLHWCLVIWRINVRFKTKVKIRQVKDSDIGDLIKLDQSWPQEVWEPEINLHRRIKTSPDTCFIAETKDGDVVGILYCRLLDHYNENNPPSWREIAGNGNFTPPKNPTVLYGVGLTVTAKAPKGTSDFLLLAAAQYIIKNRIPRILFGSRLPGFHRFAGKMSLEEYIRIHQQGHYLDPELRLYIAKSTINLFFQKITLLRVLKGIDDYFPDPDSLNCAAILEFRNSFFKWPIPKFWAWILKIIVL